MVDAITGHQEVLDMADIRFAGGVNELNDQTSSLQECIVGENHVLAIGNTQLVPRNSFRLSATHADGNSIDGILQIVKKDQTDDTLIISGTKVDEWDGATTFTNKAAITDGGPYLGTTWQLDDVLIVTDISLNNRVKSWDGTTYTDLTTGLTPVDLHAKYSLVHNGRVWFFNIKTGASGVTVTPHLIVASEFENHEVYDASTRAQDSSFTTGDEAFFLTSPDLKPINGAWVFLEEIIFSTIDGRLYKITGSSSEDYAVIPFYFGSAATGNLSYANIGNDSTFMRKDGRIELLSSVETSGDQKANDLSLKIPNQIDGLTGAIIVYDERKQIIYYFVDSKVLVCFKELIGSQLSPWMVFKTSHPNSFNATMAAYIREPGTTSYRTFWGDEDGNIFHMDGSGDGDAGSYSIFTKRKLSIIDTNYGDTIRGRVVYRQTNEVPFNIFVEWGDELKESSCSLTLTGDSSNATNYYSGEIYYSNGSYYQSGGLLGTAPVSKGFSPAGRGLAAFITLTSNTTKSWTVDKLIINDSAIAQRNR